MRASGVPRRQPFCRVPRKGGGTGRVHGGYVPRPTSRALARRIPAQHGLGGPGGHALLVVVQAVGGSSPLAHPSRTACTSSATIAGAYRSVECQRAEGCPLQCRIVRPAPARPACRVRPGEEARLLVPRAAPLTRTRLRAPPGHPSARRRPAGPRVALRTAPVRAATSRGCTRCRHRSRSTFGLHRLNQATRAVR